MSQQPQPVALRGARIFTGAEWLEGHALLLDSGKVAGCVDEQAIPAGYAPHSLEGGMLVPGLVDVQVNGGGGVLFNDQPDIAGLRTMMAAHRAHGTTAMLPTLITDTDISMQQAIAVIKQARRESLPGIAGIHLEGPYLNVGKKGVHRASQIRVMDEEHRDWLLALAELGSVVLTLAPEQLPDLAWITALAERGVRVCAGHTLADYRVMQAALQHGVAGFTHLFNAMSGMQSRDPGVVGAALEDVSSWCGLIVDGHHVHPASLKVAIRAKARGKMMLVTDAMHTVGVAGEEFALLGEAIYRRDGCLKTADGTLAGSDLGMLEAVRNSVEMLGLPLEEALRMGSLYPAQFLRRQDLGHLHKGAQADVLWLSEALQLRSSWIGGVAEHYC